MINLAQKLSLFDELWTPKIIGGLNGQLLKLAKIKDEFTWHTHANEDEMFLVLDGSLTIQLRGHDGQTNEVQLNTGEMYIVPRGVEHNPISESGASILLLEPEGTQHTGEFVGERTVVDQEWI
jgi:mannose-6-phosphate isomerase-like protein (cupin superfamily)